MICCKYCTSSKPCIAAETSKQLKIHVSANEIVNAYICENYSNEDQFAIVPGNYEDCEYFEEEEDEYGDM